ncbi:MAG: Choline trimethylamine-lyase [Syntrophomonadaceae bacterium]|nr:Choline trimethylamine-lyase [Bacillota bacterium]
MKSVVLETKCSERIKRLKERLQSRYFELDIERARYFTRSYRRTEGEPPCMRASKGLEETLRNMTIRIEDDELIVGSKSAKFWGGPMYVEGYDGSAYTKLSLLMYNREESVEELFPEGFALRSAKFLKKFTELKEEEYRELTEDILPYWKDKNIGALRIESWKREGLYPDVPFLESIELGVKVFGDSSIILTGVTDIQGHISVGIKKVLEMGFKGIARQALHYLVKLKEYEKDYQRRKDFLESVQTAAEAVCIFADRYAILAEKMARDENGKRKLELLEIAERCRRVPAEPPRNFMEALQSIWLTQAAVLISYGDGSITAPGRLDQYLYPYYKQDLESGRITRSKALEMLEEYYIKLATNINIGPNNVTIGGVDQDGENAVNEVSHLFLEAHENLKGCFRNSLAVRLSEKTPRDFLLKAGEVHRHTAGIAFHNDHVVIRDLLADGYTLEAARDYCVVGCVETTGTGNNNGYAAGNSALLQNILEMTLNEGGRYVTGWRRVGAATPHAGSFKSFDDVKKAFADQLGHVVELVVQRAYLKDQAIAEHYPVPLLSSTIEGCVELGEDFTRGGARFNHGCVNGQSLATLANSLAAIRWAVYDRKLLTIEELVTHLRNDFEGAEEVRRQLLGAPKYGNDDPYVDDLAVWVADTYSKEVMKHKFWMGGVHRPCLISVQTHILEGTITGATPDGRLAGSPLSNGISPSNGTERNGMTATLRSAAAACGPIMSDGVAFNMNINPAAIQNDEGLDKFVSLLEAYFALGGRQIQFNPISRATLLDAQQHPENYPELLVKVSGYSYRFVDLHKRAQDDIIARTEFNNVE